MACLVPALREQELLYSAIARGRRYLHAGEAGPFMRELLGRRWAVATVDLPGGLGELAGCLPDAARGSVVDSWIDEGTLLPFHTAFMPTGAREEARAAMRGVAVGLHARLGLAAFRVRPPERLRFCPDCLSAMEAGERDPWWRRDHQLPGVCVCPVHGTMLRISDVSPADERHAYVAATRGVCRDDSPLAIEQAGQDDAVLLVDLARLAAALLSGPPPARDPEEIMTGYRSRLAEVGLMRSRRKVDHAALHAAFRERWRGVTELIPGMELSDDPARSWLSALIRNSRRAAPPLQHVMLTAMLERLAAAEADRPFGPGPWPCRNPVAGHCGADVIRDVEIRRDRGTLYGDFACACGYLYTRSRSPEGVIGEPKYRRFGPLLAPALAGAIASGESLRATARSLGLDAKTLMREAAMAGVDVPWSTRASGVVPGPTPPKAVSPATPSRKRHRRRLRNWFSIDARLVRSLGTVVSMIQVEVPPVRVTWAEVERRIARRDWLQKRRLKLPRTVAAMEAAAEATDAFRRRRLDWCVAKALHKGNLRPCEVLREAGLPMGWLGEVRTAVAMARLPSGPSKLAA